MDDNFICRLRECLKNKVKKVSEILHSRRLCDTGEDKVSDIRSRCNSFSGLCYDINYKIYKCPKCRQKLRVPRGKGKIRISCRRCQYEFIRKT